jgi:N-acetylglucosamine-6-phosphate deacetylase
MSEILPQYGVTSFIPTCCTAKEDKLIEKIKAIVKSMGKEKGANILGIHLEGPFINKKHKGAQNEANIIKPDMELFCACDNVKLITLAPEIEGAMEFIESCPAVTVLGHSDATYEIAKEAFNKGVRSITHTFNAMAGIHHREPGAIGAGSDDGRVYAQLISDGKHVHPSAVRMLVKIFGEDKVVLISDSMQATGMADGEYKVSGLHVTVTNGFAYTDDGHLAGSTSTLSDCVRCAVTFGIPEATAVKMASENPARLMGLNKGKVEVGYDADLIMVKDDFRIVKSIVRGEL